MAEMNPRNPDRVPADEEEVSFVPMSAVEAGTGRMNPKKLRPWGQVRKGYTRFQEGDVLFAKITPCMENGKTVVAIDLHGGVGAGSTEFHVLRPYRCTDNVFLMYYLLQESFRREARSRMTGTAGQLRVPKRFLEGHELRLPPLPEQHRIVEAIESYLTRLDDAVASLERAQKNLKRYQASVLKAAVEGRLVPTEAELARKEGRAFEPADVLLERILKERRRRWEEAELARMKTKGKTPKNDKWKEKYKEPVAPDTSDLPDLPEGWCYVALPILVLPTKAGMKTGPFGSLLQKSEHRGSGVPIIGIENIEPMRFMPGSKIHVTAEKSAQLSGYDVLAGDLLISRSGTVGEVCVCPPSLGEARLSTNVMRIRFMETTPVPEFVATLLNGSPLVRGQISELCKGTTRDFLNQKILQALVLPFPPILEQRRILEEVGRLLSLGDATAGGAGEALGNSQRLRQSILKWAFEGKLVDQDPNDLPAPGPGKYFVYALECSNGSHYIGQTQDVLKRWKQHASARGADWTKQYPPVGLAHWEEFDSLEAAVRREKELKTGFGRKWLKLEITAGRARQAGEPASVLLERIKAERAALEAKKKANKRKTRRKK